MATATLQVERNLLDLLLQEPWSFDFFQAVSLLERLYPEASAVGGCGDPRSEAVRFRSRISFEFPASEIRDIAPGTNGLPREMTVNVMGLAGALGPLPAPYTEFVLERLARRDSGARDFLDIFNHRLVSLMYRVRRLHRVALTTARPEEERIATHLYCFLGLGSDHLQQRMPVPDRVFLRYAGILTQRPRSAAALGRVLGDYFGTKVEVEQCAGSWRTIAADQWTYLGSEERNNTLGRTAALGTRVWDDSGAFCLSVGPIGFRFFQQFLPEPPAQFLKPGAIAQPHEIRKVAHRAGPAFTALTELTRFYVGSEFDFHLRLTLKAAEVPESRLGSTRLGWTSWLKTRPEQKQDSQVLLQSCPQARRAPWLVQ